VQRVWIYGSRARGTAILCSDLDVAVDVHDIGSSDDSNTVFVCSAESWRAELSPALLPYKLDLKHYDTSGNREKVRRAVDADGILIYERTT
jgi:uncharacterized protein